MSIKILHIASSLSGGAGIACLRFHQALIERGVESVVLTHSYVEGFQNVYRVFEKRKSFLYRVMRKLRMNFIYDYLFLTDIYVEQKVRKFDYEAFALTRQGSDFKDFLNSNKFDVINLHWIASKVNLDGLLRATGNTEVIWTLHDMNAFTGGCTASVGCNLYKTSGCENCPQLHYTLEDIAKRNFERKKKIFSKKAITIISSSQQLYENSKTSILLRSMTHKLIPLANFNLIKVKSKRDILKVDFGLSNSKVIVGFGATGLNRENKGLRLLVNTLNSMDNSKFQLVIFGHGDLSKFDMQNIDYKYFEYVKDLNQIAILYTIMDVFVSISNQEAFGQTFMEALCLGTPIIGTPTGAIPDFINATNGIIINDRTEENLKNAILRFKTDDFDRDTIAQKARTDFSPQSMIDSYISLYEDIKKKNNT